MSVNFPHAEARQVAGGLLSAVRKPTPESVLVHCLSRAVIARNGWEKSEEEAQAGTFKLNQWVGARVAPKATRVALFITSWAAAMRADGRDEYTITEYARFWNDTERGAYRLQKEFRELWPEFGHPTIWPARSSPRESSIRARTSAGRSCRSRYLSR